MATGNAREWRWISKPAGVAGLARRRWAWGGAAALVALVALALLVLAALFPWGILKGTVERHLSARFGRPVTIASMQRLDRFGFTPTLAITGLRIPQPRWAGSGDFARVARAEASFSIWPLLAGRFEPRDVAIRGLRLALVRAADGRTNWSRPGGGQRGGNNAVALAELTVSDSLIIYRDARQHRQIAARFTADPRHGVRAAGSGTIRGAAVTLSLNGPPVAAHAGEPWPFTATLNGGDLAMTARGRMDRPFDTDHMTLDVSAHARDLRLIDAVIEAGLPGTQAVRLSAHVRHDAPDWTITGLRGTVGRSMLAGALTVRKRNGRTALNGSVVASQLAFEDFSSDQGLAEGAALERRIGLRLVPNTRIDLANFDTTDGRIDFRIAHILGQDGPSTLRWMRGTATLDHQRLTVEPFAIGLTRGTIAGRIVVNQGGRPVPRLVVDLALRNSSITALAGGGGAFTGTVSGHARLAGRGATIREAIGNSDGAVGLVARDGVLPARTADALGFDAGRALFASRDDQAGLRCVVLHLTVTGGRGRISPLIVDTTQSQLQGQGSITFPDEALAIELTGAPKRGSILRLPGSATMTGTIREPHVTVPPEVKSFGNVLKAIGRAITGRQGPTATNADCDALAVAALR